MGMAKTTRKRAAPLCLTLASVPLFLGCASRSVSPAPTSRKTDAPAPEATALPDRAERAPLAGPIFSEELLRQRAESRRKTAPHEQSEPSTAPKEVDGEAKGGGAPPLTETPTAGGPPSEDPPGEELALLIAAELAQRAQQRGLSLPPPHNPHETNNYFALVRTAEDLAQALPTYALSQDGKKIAFVRKQDLSIWLASAQGTHARKVFTANQDRHLDWDGQEEVLHTSGIFDLQFSPGGQLLYFQTDLAATSLGLQVYDERRRQVKLLTSANGYDIIRECARQPGLVGHIIAYRHDYSVLVAQATDLYFLLGPRGNQVGLIGPDLENVARFLYQACGHGAPVPAAKNEIVPPEMRRTNICDDRAYRYMPLRFLDGSVWQIFYAVNKDKATSPQQALDMDDYQSPAMGLEEAAEALSRCRTGE